MLLLFLTPEPVRPGLEAPTRGHTTPRVVWCPAEPAPWAPSPKLRQDPHGQTSRRCGRTPTAKCHRDATCQASRLSSVLVDEQDSSPWKKTPRRQQARPVGPVGLPGAAVVPGTIEERVGQPTPGRRLRRAAVAPPSPGAQGDVFAEEEADNRGKWAVLRTPNIVAGGACCCCPRQAEAAALSQPRAARGRNSAVYFGSLGWIRPPRGPVASP